MGQQIAQELREKRGSTTSYCGIPVPANVPDYELPDWPASDVVIRPPFVGIEMVYE
jgi:hypothetical protein